MYKLLYIGKSNKRFTHNKTYKHYSGGSTKQFFYACVYYNNSQIMTFKDMEYFDKNFKLLTENEYNQLIRKLKLNKINKNEGLF